MPRWNKANCRRDGTRIFFACPLCRNETELVLGPHDYSITEIGVQRGQVSPDFVCMHRPSERYCEFSGPLWIVNY